MPEPLLFTWILLRLVAEAVHYYFSHMHRTAGGQRKGLRQTACPMCGSVRDALQACTR